MAKLFDYDVPDAQRVRDVRKSFIMQIAMESPVISMMKKAPKPTSNIVEWPLKTYSAPRTTGVVDGTDVTSDEYENNQANKTMLGGRYQHFRRVPAVSNEADVMEQYGGVTDPMMDNVTDKTLEIWRDLEATILSDNESVASATGVASLLRGITRWLSNANARFTDTQTTPAAAYRTPVTSIVTGKALAANVSEDDFLNLLLNVSKARLKSTTLLGICTPDMRARADSYTRTDEKTTATNAPVYRFNHSDASEVSFEVKRFSSSQGNMDLMTHYYLPNDVDGNPVHVIALDKEKVEVGTVKAPAFRELPDLGGGRRGIIEAKIVLECLAPNAHGIIKAGATA